MHGAHGDQMATSASSSDDDLELNRFYNYALNRQSHLLQVITNGSILCIPAGSTLPMSAFTDRFLDLHLLKPSPLYKGQYLTTWSNVNGQHQSVSWDETNMTLTATYAGMSNVVKILSHEAAYIQMIKYNILLIDRPLDSHRGSYANEYLVDSVYQTSETLELRKTSAEDIELFMTRYNSQGLASIRKDIQHFKSKYIVLPTFLKDAATKLEAIVDKPTANACSDKHMQIVTLSYTHTQTFDHIYPHVKDIARHDDETYLQQCHKMQAMNRASNCAEMSMSYSICGLAEARSPLHILSILKLTLDEICQNSSDLSPTKEPFSSDDLIPMLIDVLSHSDDIELPSILLYVQIFSSRLMDFNEAFEFSLATFKAAMQYISDYKFIAQHQTSAAIATNQDNRSASYTETTASKTLPSKQQRQRTKDPGTLLSEYVKPYSTAQPFKYVYDGSAALIDRYAIIASLSN